MLLSARPRPFHPPQHAQQDVRCKREVASSPCLYTAHSLSRGHLYKSYIIRHPRVCIKCVDDRGKKKLTAFASQKQNSFVFFLAFEHITTINSVYYSLHFTAQTLSTNSRSLSLSPLCLRVCPSVYVPPVCHLAEFQNTYVFPTVLYKTETNKKTPRDKPNFWCYAQKIREAGGRPIYPHTRVQTTTKHGARRQKKKQNLAASPLLLHFFLLTRL